MRFQWQWQSNGIRLIRILIIILAMHHPRVVMRPAKSMKKAGRYAIRICEAFMHNEMYTSTSPAPFNS